MTVTEAVLTLRRLDQEAMLGWPEGYDEGATLARASEAIQVMAGAVAKRPEAQRLAYARKAVAALHLPSVRRIEEAGRL